MVQTIERLAKRASEAAGKAVAANNGCFDMKLGVCPACGDVHFYFFVDGHKVFKGTWLPETAAQVARDIQSLLLELDARGSA